MSLVEEAVGYIPLRLYDDFEQKLLSANIDTINDLGLE